MSKPDDLSTAPTRPAMQGPMPRQERRVPPTLIEVMDAITATHTYLGGEVKDVGRAVSSLAGDVRGLSTRLDEHGRRIDALERADRAALARTGPRDRLPSLSEAKDTAELEALDAQAGAPPSLPDRIARLEGSEIRTRRHATRGPLISAAMISLAIAIADVAKAWILHR